MIISFWLDGSPFLIASQVPAGLLKDEGLIRKINPKSIQYSVRNYSFSAFNPYVQNLLQTKKVLDEIQSNNVHLPRNKEVKELTNLLNLQLQLDNIISDANLAAGCALLLKTPALISSFDSEVRFMPAKQARELNDAEIDSHLYVPSKSSDIPPCALSGLFDVVLNEGDNVNAAFRLLDGARRNGLCDLYEKLLQFGNITPRYNFIRSSNLGIFVSVMRHAFIHGYKFETEAKKFGDHLPLRWRNNIVSIENNLRYRGRIPVDEFSIDVFIQLVADFAMIVCANIKSFPEKISFPPSLCVKFKSNV